MAEYHKYVFDTNKRELIGDFEKMYQQESCANFDSWHQEDSRKLNRKIALNILDQWNFQSIIDLGCGKGALTHLLKKQNNEVLGVDVSQAAIDVACSRFPDILFEMANINNVSVFDELIGRVGAGKGVDLVFASECLSYIENWKGIVEAASMRSKFLMISLYIPENPIGFVKSREELESTVSENFELLESIHLIKSRFTVLFAKSKLINAV